MATGENKTSFSNYHAFIIFVYFLIVSNGDFNNIDKINQVLFIVILISLIIRLFQSRIIFGKYLAWLILFAILNVASYFWAINADYAFMGIKVIINILPFSIYLYSLIKNKADIERVLKLFIIATILNTIYVLSLHIGFSLGSVFRLANGLGKGWNPNSLGMQAAFAFCFGLWLFNEAKVLKKTILLFAVVFLLITVFLTGSKKALLIVILFPVLQYFTFQNKSKIKYLFLIVISLIIGYYLIFELPIFYNTIGLRIDQFVNSLGNVSSGDRSGDLARLAMIERGWDYFILKPILGYGAWNYAYINGLATSSYIYSHNNYIEMLVDFGALGALFYYFSYIYLLKNSIRRVHNGLVFSLVICLLITDLAFVSYYCFYYHIILIICFALIENSGVKGNNK